MDNAKFLGRMAAMVSHDLCNVLATIQQASGLLGDYLSLAKKESLLSAGIRPKFKYHEKFQEIISQVQAQVDRGQGICEKLSILGHAPDDGQDGADVGLATALVGSLCGRMAKKHKVALEIVCAQEQLRAAVPLIDVLTALEAAVLGVAWRCRDQQHVVRLIAGRSDSMVHVDILCPELDAASAQALAGDLSGGKPGIITTGIVQGGVRLAFAEAGR
jgi:hypothetical protein